MTHRALFGSFLTVLLVFSSQPIAAQSYGLIKYLDTGTQVPGADPGVLFTTFDFETPSFDNDLMVFEGRFSDPGTGASEGVFVVDAGGVVTKIAFNTDAAPGGGALGFVNLELIRDGAVSFDSGSGDGEGIYLSPVGGGGPITAIVDTTDTLPGSSELFSSFGEYGRDGDWVIFEGDDQSGDERVYLRSISNPDNFLVYADENTASPFPGAAATLTNSFSEPTANDGSFSVRAFDTNGVFGLLTDFGSGIVGPVNSTVAPPSGLGNFTTFDESSIDGNKVAFQAGVEGSSNAGIYLYDHGDASFTTIADMTVPKPGGGFFDEFNGNPSLSVEDGVTTVIFETTAAHWAWVDGELIRIAFDGEVIDGKTIQNITNRFPYGAKGTTTALRIRFEDSSAALYLAILSFFFDGFED